MLDTFSAPETEISPIGTQRLDTVRTGNVFGHDHLGHAKIQPCPVPLDWKREDRVELDLSVRPLSKQAPDESWASQIALAKQATRSEPLPGYWVDSVRQILTVASQTMFRNKIERSGIRSAEGVLEYQY